MSPSLTLALIILGLILLITFLNFHVHKDNHIAIVERLGKYFKTIDKPGIYFLFPLVDRIVEEFSTESFFVSKRINQQDNQTLPKIITYRIKVIDPMAYTYNSLDAVQMIHDYITQTLLLDMDRSLVFDEAVKYAEQFGVELQYIEYNN